MRVSNDGPRATPPRAGFPRHLRIRYLPRLHARSRVALVRNKRRLPASPASRSRRRDSRAPSSLSGAPVTKTATASIFNQPATSPDGRMADRSTAGHPSSSCSASVRPKWKKPGRWKIDLMAAENRQTRRSPSAAMPLGGARARWEGLRRRGVAGALHRLPEKRRPRFGRLRPTPECGGQAEPPQMPIASNRGRILRLA